MSAARPAGAAAPVTAAGLREASLALLLAPLRLFLGLLDRLAATLDAGPAANRPGAVRLRRVLGAVTLALALVVTVRSVHQGGMVSPGAVVMAVLAVAVYTNRGGRFARDWLPVFLAFVAYALVAKAVPDLGLEVHYTPQIEAERLLSFGALPTISLQEWLYGGTTGALEVFSLLMYTSHFLAPVLLACVIWLWWPGRAFQDLLYGIVLVSFLAEAAFLLAPTAPPWLAAERGLIPPVEPVLKEALADLGLHELAAAKGDASLYNVVAAVPSLHVAWPVVALLVVRQHRLPSPFLWAQGLLLAGVVFAIVYTGEHYLVDAVAGAAFALAAWWIVRRALGPSRRPERVRPRVEAPRVSSGEPAPVVLHEGDAVPGVRTREVSRLPPDRLRRH